MSEDFRKLVEGLNLKPLTDGQIQKIYEQEAEHFDITVPQFKVVEDDSILTYTQTGTSSTLSSRRIKVLKIQIDSFINKVRNRLSIV